MATAGPGHRARCGGRLGLITYVVEAKRGAGLDPAGTIAALGKALKDDPAVEMVAPFGISLHISGHDAARLEAALARTGSGRT